MQNHLTEAYALARMRTTASSSAATAPADVWVPRADLNRLRQETNRQAPLEELPVNRPTWTSLAAAFGYRPAVGGA